jgi:serine/threonine protein kinase
MVEDKQKPEEAIFKTAIQLEKQEDRQAYVRDACGDDRRLLADVQALLQYHDSSSFLDAPVLEPNVRLDESPVVEGPGTVIGRYKLLERIGEGGMAVVYMAEQEQPIRRKVALKIIKLGMDTRQVIARFEAERQALALMDHPSIAKVLDAGATETGRPYFVMELVQGVSITEYCDKNNLSTKDRLALFVQVCNAVQHAHQKGIIHRDIKPSNVMVTHHDGKPVPKVIDFGIAKATNQRLTEKTLFTRYAHLIGTPAYMSPEQAELSDLDIDTRTDIYSLGVLLYELLTGTTPFSEEELRKAGYIEMQRVIREQEPAKPSTKLSTLGDTLTDIAQRRSSTPDLLRKAIRGDLDWIVMKTLEKTRDRRYDNASALAQDVHRHLDNQPILARPPSTIYRIHKFIRRHRSPAIIVLIALPLLFTTIMMSLMWSRDRIHMKETEALKHRTIFTQANTYIEKNDLKRAIAHLTLIANSKHIGDEAGILYDQIMHDIQEQVHVYTEKIENNPEDANNYLKRGQYSHCLDDRDSVLTDMKKYVSSLYPISETSSRSRRLYDFLVGLWTGIPTNVGPNINSSYSDWSPCISSDGLYLLFNSNRASTYLDRGLWMATRGTTSDPWRKATYLGPPVDGRLLDGGPAISADGLSLYFAWKRASWDICVSTRKTTDDVWGEPVGLGPTVNSWATDTRPAISTDGLELFFTSTRSGGYGNDDIYISTRATTNHPWGEPVNLGSIINSPFADGYPNTSADGLLLFFSSFRTGGSGGDDIWVTTRETKLDEWGPPVNLGPTVNSPYNDGSPCISADGSTLYFSSGRPGGYGGSDLWQVSIASAPGVVEKGDDTDPNRPTFEEDRR